MGMGRKTSSKKPTIMHIRSTTALLALSFFLIVSHVTSLSTGSPSFAVFGNKATRDLIRSWSPKPLKTSSGNVLLPSSTDNMKRFVRARILLEEDPKIGCFASFDDALSVILCEFTEEGHKVVLPLWPPNTGAVKTFRGLKDWHEERLSHKPLSGKLENREDR